MQKESEREREKIESNKKQKVLFCKKVEEKERRSFFGKIEKLNCKRLKFELQKKSSSKVARSNDFEIDS